MLLAFLLRPGKIFDTKHPLLHIVGTQINYMEPFLKPPFGVLSRIKQYYPIIFSSIKVLLASEIYHRSSGLFKQIIQEHLYHLRLRSSS